MWNLEGLHKLKSVRCSRGTFKFPTVQQKTELEVLSTENHRKVMQYVRENFTFRNLGIYICLSCGPRREVLASAEEAEPSYPHPSILYKALQGVIKEAIVLRQKRDRRRKRMKPR